jgi:hypothetical protein
MRSAVGDCSSGEASADTAVAYLVLAVGVVDAAVAAQVRHCFAML